MFKNKIQRMNEQSASIYINEKKEENEQKKYHHILRKIRRKNYKRTEYHSYDFPHFLFLTFFGRKRKEKERKNMIAEGKWSARKENEKTKKMHKKKVSRETHVFCRNIFLPAFLCLLNFFEQPLKACEEI